MGTPPSGHLERQLDVCEQIVHRNRIHRFDRSVRPLGPSYTPSSRGIITPRLKHRNCLNFGCRVEHLHEEELSKFAPTLLGVYHPRLLLITTPSYTFNARFTAPTDGSQSMPSEEDSKVREGGFLDPTRRTSRVFRHPDHKFEWTIREFEEWCATTARKWGYTVRTGGIGKPMEEDGWGRDSELGYATQTAVFTRLEGTEQERLRAENARGYLQASRRSPELLAAHHHVPHPAVTSPPQSNEMILELIKEEIDRGDDNKILLRYLWIEEVICSACSGRIAVLIGAINAAENVLRLHITDPGALEDWVVELIGSSKRRKENLWEDQQNDGADTYHDISDEERGSQSEESEGLEWEDGGPSVDVNMEPEETATSGWGTSGEINGDWGFQADGFSHSGWGTTDHGASGGGWGRDRDGPWTS